MKKTNFKRFISFAAVFSILCSGASFGVSAADISDYVRMNESVSYEMTEADYWIGNYQGDADSVMLSESRIKKIAEENRLMITVGDDTFSILDLEGDTIDGNIVRTLVSGVSAPSDPSCCYLNGKPTTEAYWNNLEKKLNIDNIPDTVELKYGYSVARSSLRTYPSYDFIGEDKTDRFYDVLVMSEFMPYRPLLVVHESTDGNWYYVIFEGFAGWVHKKYVALCDSKEDWLERNDPEEFLVVTGKELRLQDDVKSPSISGQLIPMGTKLPLVPVSEAPEFINDRETTGCYIVKLPVRGTGGKITDKYSLVSIKEDVHIGYLEYTSANVIRLAFKRLGDRYGWAGLGHSNDCSGITGEIYRCFGIELPRVSTQIAAFNGRKTFDVSEYSDASKTELLEKLPIGSILFFRGHIMIYAGVVDGSVYCISATGTYYNGSEKMYDTNSCILTNMSKTYRADGETWLSHITKIIVI